MNLCENCRKKSSAAGQAFTPYICGHCFKPNMHENTAVPRICSACSSKFEKCQKCLQGINDKVCDNCLKIKGICRCVYSTL